MKKEMLLLMFVVWCLQGTEHYSIQALLPCVSPRQKEIIHTRHFFEKRVSVAIANQTDLAQRIEEFSRTATDDKGTLHFIKSISKKFNISDMEVTQQIHTPIAQKRFSLQKQLLESYEDCNTGLQQLVVSYANGVDLDFTFSKKDQKRLTLLLWLCQQPIYSYAQEPNEKQKHIIKCAEWLIKNGANVNELTDYGQNALGVSVSYSNQPLALLLINLENICLDQRDKEGATALYYAAFQATISSDGPPKYRQCFFQFSIDMIKALIKRKANPWISKKIKRGIPTDETETPLQFVAVFCGTEYSDDQKDIFNLLDRAHVTADPS